MPRLFKPNPSPDDKLTRALEAAGVVSRRTSGTTIVGGASAGGLQEDERKWCFGIEDPGMNALLTDPLGRIGSKRAEIRRVKHKLDVEEGRLFDKETTILSEQEAAFGTAAVAVTMESHKATLDWMGRGFHLERPTTSRLDEALSHLLSVYGNPQLAKALRGSEVQSVLIEHDWLSVIQHSPDFNNSEWRLPYPCCGFEFRISGIHTVALVIDDETNGPTMSVIYRFGKRKWAMDRRPYAFGPAGWRDINTEHLPALNFQRSWWKFIDGLYKHIKACAIMLDAEVAVTTPVRAPYRSNLEHKQWAEKPPHVSFHTISIAKRARAAALPCDEQEATGRRVRLHFRRGHWRHFATHRTWIKWQLIGDPDLGLVEKTYRL